MFVLESNRTMNRIILASNSPRRRELLALTGLEFISRPVDVDETPLPGEQPAECVTRLAGLKAAAALQHAATEGSLPGDLILTSDTIVAMDGCIYCKPRNAADARAMLAALRGRTHEVLTAITLARPADRRMATTTCDTPVPMRAYSDAEMDAYISSGDPLDKAGAYAIQHPGFHPVERLEGCYASVMGLPLCHLARLLQHSGNPPAAGLPSACQAALKYECRVHPQVMNGDLPIMEK